VPKVYLKGNKILDVTPEQSLNLAKAIVLLPDYKEIKINGVTFTMNDLDEAAYKKSRWPQQTHLNVRVKVVEKKRRKSME
jgi:hypothetical protein